MEKTKLGISVELMAVIAVLACYFGGYTGMFLVVGYILIAEKDAWLKKWAVKAMVIALAFAFISAVIYLVPNVINCLDAVWGLININIYLPFVDTFINILNSVLGLLEKVLFLIMAVMAFLHKTFEIPVIDDFVTKNFGENE